MSEKELQEIIDSYTWIKVKQFHGEHYEDCKDAYDDLTVHHQKETEFLIEKCRELAQELIDTKKKVPWSTHKPHKDEWGNTDWRDTGEMGG